MQTKDFSITLDMMRTLPFRPFEVVEGDTGNILHVTLLNNGDAMDLSGCGIQIAFASSSGFAMQDETSGIGKTEEIGTFDVTLLPTAYGAGNVSADVQVYSGDNNATLVTSTRFDFRCRKSLISGDIIRANAAYPPLIEAARVATEAAATALAAAERINTDIGELNVQANWTETDTTQDAFIRNKPAIPSSPGDVGAAPASHAAQHQQGGSDPVTPILHAARHAAGGADVISPAAIGAAGLSNGIVAQSQARSPLIEKTASFTLAAGDVEAILLAYSSSEIIVTMPSDATYNFPIGTSFNLIRWGSGALSFSKESGTNWLVYNGVSSVSVTGGAATIVKVGANTWWLVCG
jgi:hypothetical protein